MASSSTVKIAIEGCGHGTLDAIYSSVQKSCEIRGWDGVDLLIICGDFQAVRTRKDLNVTAMPAKYREMGDFYQYYYGTKTAPYLTVFIGGNHEASNYLFELYYGGWVAPNIYYLGAANVLRLGSIKIAALSGIWKGHDYRRPHFERLPYNDETMRSIYHQRELDVRKLLAYRSQVDIGLSHDWPHEMWKHGDHKFLFRVKTFFRDDAHKGILGSKAATQVVDRLRPPYWFCAHLHFKYTAYKDHDDSIVEIDREAESRIENQREADTQPIQILRRDDASASIATSGSTLKSSQGTALQTGNANAISAWSNFSNTVEAKDAREHDEEHEARLEEEKRNGRSTVAGYNFEETFKPVSVAQIDGAQSRRSQSPGSVMAQIPQVDGSCCSVPKRRRLSSPSDEAQPPVRNHFDSRTSEAPIITTTVTNPDAIDIDISDSDDDNSVQPMLPKGQTNGSAPRTTQAAKPLLTEDTDSASESGAIPMEAIIANGTVQPKTAFTSNEAEDKNEQGKNQIAKDNNQDIADDIPKEIRAQLAEMSATFATVTNEKSADLPFPEAIKNKQTRFLALSKVEQGRDRDFLQLLEIEPSNRHEDTNCVARPLKLMYDPEWLAILRTFAPGLQLGGSSNDKVPAHRGDTYYREKIMEEEKWVNENIVEKGLLVVPENFEITVQNDAEEDGITSNTMPREQTNPQTAQFCELIGIENKFDFSEEDRDARMAAGAPVSHGRGGGHHVRGRGGSNRGGGGGGGGRGKGWGGRNRGRGGGGRGRW